MKFQIGIIFSLLIAILSGASPVSAFLLDNDDDLSHHHSEQPFDESEEEKEESKSELEELELIDSGLVCQPSLQIPEITTVRHDEPIHLPQPILTGPDHSRAPPACGSC
ncbi:MAG: hypothetical protein HUJ26_00470 [Planctomycetaceae bacterium]|nr:hypothetical protein [Planctomycetaceae bacterium]